MVGEKFRGEFLVAVGKKKEWMDRDERFGKEFLYVNFSHCRAHP
jgi:hypothetical protein